MAGHDVARFRIVIAALLAALLAGAPLSTLQPPPSPSLGAVLETRTMRVLAVRPRPGQPVPPSVPMHETKGPRCIAADTIAGAAVAGPDAVDLFLRGGDRLRARLEAACPALDFYRGFYVRPGPDGSICADRDEIRTRSGGACGIDRFRRLVPGG